MGDYRKLLVWQRARVVQTRVERLVTALPPRLRARLGDQLVRSADSIRFNIAEGAGLNSDRQLARHLKIALGSANEVQDQIETIAEAGALPESEQDLIPALIELRAMLAVFQRRVDPTAKSAANSRRPSLPADS